LTLLLLALIVIAVADQLLRHGHGGRNSDPDRRARERLFAGRHPFLFVVVFHHEPPFVSLSFSCRGPR
jgi:hypothetical protein